MSIMNLYTVVHNHETSLLRWSEVQIKLPLISTDFCLELLQHMIKG